MLNNHFWDTTILSTGTDTDHQDETLMPDHSSLQFADTDDDLEQTITNDDASKTDDFESCSSLSLSCDTIVDQVVLDVSSDTQQKRQSASKSPNIIDISGEQITVAESKKARDALEAVKLKEKCEEIRTPGFLLEDRHIDAFIAVVQSESQYSNWDMKTTLAVQSTQHYDRKPNKADRDDIQILFEGRAGPVHIGHYICIHYRADERSVFVYDSLHRRCLSPNSQEIIHRRFPDLIEPVNFVEPKTRQSDSSSCGVFAAAYATTVLFGQDPAEYSLLLKSGPNKMKTSLLRNHLAKMIEENKLSSFPQTAANGRVEVNQKMNPRVSLERLKLPIQSHDCKSPVLSQDEEQITDTCDQSNDLQDKVAVMLDDAYEEFENNADNEQTLTNRKRKVDIPNTDGNLKKKTKLKTANSTKIWECNICLFSTKHEYSYKRHLKNHDNVRPHECKHCAKRFKRNSHLTNHMKTHRNLYKFECSKCRFGFSDENEWELHETDCRAKQYKCDICLIGAFWRKRDLSNHMLKHTDEKPCCSICKKQFKNKYILRWHMKTHAAQWYQYHCPKCRLGFEHKEECEFHASRCHGTQYECHLCKINFYNRKSNLFRHMRLKHLGEKPFVCTKMCCQQPFNANSKSKYCPNCRKRSE